MLQGRQLVLLNVLLDLLPQVGDELSLEQASGYAPSLSFETQ
jgi:hypothetical protein